MIAQTLALAMALAFTAPAFAAQKAPHKAPHKASQNKPRNQIVAENKDVVIKTTVNGVWGKNKKLEKIIAVAAVPLAQIPQIGKTGKARKKGDATLTVVEAKNGKRTISRKNLDKSSELNNKMRLALDEAIAFYKQNHVEASSSFSSSGKKKKK